MMKPYCCRPHSRLFLSTVQAGGQVVFFVLFLRSDAFLLPAKLPVSADFRAEMDNDFIFKLCAAFGHRLTNCSHFFILIWVWVAYMQSGRRSAS
ncbi:hypothetical protein ABW09_22480 [Pluralibacter gergoviae]|nr:hypothetical protein ABW09_22480 [Pluralibacter gergoviae]